MYKKLVCVFLLLSLSMFLVMFFLISRDKINELFNTTEKNKIKVCCNHDVETNSISLLNTFEPYLPKNKKIFIAGSFIKDETHVENIRRFKGLKILYVSEPIEFFFKEAYNLYQEGIFDIVIGCVENQTIVVGNKLIKHIKYPLYLFNETLKTTPTIFEEVNKMVKNQTKTTLKSKKFCSLINNHDKGNTRTNIYKKLVSIGEITCPSKLFNNCSNEELNRIGKVEYGKNFLFSICPENFDVKLKGYITEKIIDACLSGCIPIYFGNMDSADLLIFNKKRILNYNPFDNKSINDVVQKINFLMSNEDELLEFYRQDVFLPTALKSIKNMESNLKNQLELIN
jgi:hypothetical protein